MSPNTSGGTISQANGDTDGAADVQTRREQLNVLTQETRFTLIQNILAHPKQLPSLNELDYYNPSKSKSTIRNHLETLLEYELIEEQTLPEDERTRDLPWKFYGLTTEATALLEDGSLMEAEETLQDIYALLELSDEMTRYAEAPRPDTDLESSPLDEEIRAAKSNTQSVDDQIDIARAMYRADIGPDADGQTKPELKQALSVEPSYRLETSLKHLREIGLVETVTPAGPNVYAISERLDEIINGRVGDIAAEDLENLISHMEDELYAIDMDTVQDGGVVAVADGAGKTIRAILAEQFGIEPEAVVDYLRDGDPVKRLNAAVDAIESSDHVTSGSEYGRIIFRRPANRYRLTDDAITLLAGE